MFIDDPARVNAIFTPGVPGVFGSYLLLEDRQQLENAREVVLSAGFRHCQAAFVSPVVRLRDIKDQPHDQAPSLG